jgi:hypothetical protein
MLISISIAGLVFADAVRGQVSAQLASLVGESGARGIESLLAGAGRPSEGVLAMGFLLLGVPPDHRGAFRHAARPAPLISSLWRADPPRYRGLISSRVRSSIHGSGFRNAVEQ